MSASDPDVADPHDAVVRRHVRVTGRVQNVTYRDSTREQAERLGVVGWVRNCPDGSVEAELEGSEAVLDDLLRWMHDGPLLARVDAVEVEVVPPAGDERFRVR
ncbi:acylphosphatase [Microlunatus flavus]|uniref:acylphosphatase n=1 Tax=Microlunatus flavus TaxID=1036181 RepID=A0A1H9K0K3_9ACTN|nr:acylphosphatase [Microlunatus flavus]SEQ92443.1 acylphosphatase [Microlunatus flavus]